MLWVNRLVLSVFLMFSVTVQAVEDTSDVSGISGSCGSGEFQLSWNAFGETWNADVKQVDYLENEILIIDVFVRTGSEKINKRLPNFYYLGVLLDDKGDPIEGTRVYLDCSIDNALPFIGFVTRDNDLYLIEKGGSTSSGIQMRIEITENDIAGESVIVDGDVDGNKGWKKGGKGGVLKPKALIPRGASPADFSTLDIYVDPSYRANVGESNYISRVLQNLAVANIIYEQSGIRLIQLKAIVLPSEDIARSSSQGNVLHGVERLRRYTVDVDSTDSSMVYSGEIFNQPSLWGWAELGFGCELQQAVVLGSNINTQQVGKAAFALIDLPTLMQRGWIFAHEMSHTIGGGHVEGDPLSDGFFQPDLILSDYIASPDARQFIYKSCAFDSQTKAFIDFYE